MMYSSEVVSQANEPFPEFDPVKVKMECGALKSMGLKLPKTVEKLKRKYMKILGPLTEV